MATHLVFVYGTLKHGAWNHARLLSGAEYLGVATTRQSYVMTGRNGSVPTVFDRPQDAHIAPVRGEVYAVDDDTLAALDRLEGHPRHYRRDLVSVCFDGTVAHAEAWLYMGPASRLMADWVRPPVDGAHDWHMDLPCNSRQSNYV